MIRIVFTLLMLMTSVSEAGQKGNAGDGFALLFTEMARRIHREALMAPYQAQAIQLRDDIPLEGFYAAIMGTKVVSSDEPLIDNHGHPATAIYLSPEQLTARWKSEGLSAAQIQARMAEFPLGLIQINRLRFQQEIQLGLGAALKTVFHEYVRVMGLSEVNYRFAANPELTQFFARLYDQSSPVTKQLLSTGPGLIDSNKIDLIDREQARLKLVMSEDRADLVQTLERRGQKVQELRASYTRYGMALADTIGAMGMVPMPFPSYAAETLRGMVRTTAEGMTHAQKVSEQEVIDQQVQFLRSRLDANADFFLKLDQRRREIVLKALE